MKKIITALSVVTAFAVTQHASAETTSATTTAATGTTATSAATTAILDINQILSDSKAAKGLNEQMNALRVKYEQEIFKKEESLRAKEKELEKLAGAKLEKARADLETQVAQFQKTIMMQQNQLQLAAQQAMDQIREKVVNISNEIAKKEGFIYVQPAAGFLYYPENTDITKQTIARLDKELPSVKVQVKEQA